MYSENDRRKSRTVSGVIGILAVIAALILALLLAGCGNDSKGSSSGKDKSDREEETVRFKTPEEQYRYVEGAELGKMGAGLAGAFDDALQSSSLTDQKVDTEITLELFEPAEQMLESYTGMDFSWLRTLGLRAGVNLTEDAAAAELSLSLNGRELIGADTLVDLTRMAVYGRVPRLSKDYFQTELDPWILYNSGYPMMRQQQETLSALLPDGKTVSKLISRCAEAALEQVDDVEEGSGKLTAGDVSAKYTTLTWTLTEDLLQDMVEAVCDVLKEDKDVEDIIGKIEEMQQGQSLYDEFLEQLDRLPDRVRLDEDIEITVYVDKDNAVRGRVIEVGDTVFRYAMPEDDGDFGFELAIEDARDGDVFCLLTGEGKERKNAIEGTFTFEMDETELFTLSVEDLDTEALGDGELIGTFTFKPTYDFYTKAGVYSLTARTLEEFSLALELGKNDMALTVYMDDEPFASLTERVEHGRAERLSDVSDAEDVTSWARSLMRSGALEDYMNYLKGSDIPEELLRQLLGAAF